MKVAAELPLSGSARAVSARTWQSLVGDEARITRMAAQSFEHQRSTVITS